jgi:pyruvate/2-oxoglutarate dehydrogenase complex dihydrolipoamide dehydrogenase (E3) component
VVPVEDEDVSKELSAVFKKQKIAWKLGARAENIEKTGSGVQLTLTTKDGKQEQLQAEKLLVAVGRKPNTDKIGWRTPRCSWTAASSRSTATSRPMNRAFTRSATWWRGRRNWRTWRRARA